MYKGPINDERRNLKCLIAYHLIHKEIKSLSMLITCRYLTKGFPMEVELSRQAHLLFIHIPLLLREPSWKGDMEGVIEGGMERDTEGVMEGDMIMFSLNMVDYPMFSLLLSIRF